MPQHRISLEDFSQRLERAAAKAIAVAKPMVRQELPSIPRFLLEPNQSFDKNPLVQDEETFPDDVSPTPPALTLEELARWLWRSGKIPEWVDIRVYDADHEATYIRVEACGRFTALHDLLYHVSEGYPPFHVTSPALPSFDWESVETSGRFDLEGRWDTGSSHRSATY